jgi:CheY-like chemotaxis protein
LSKLGIDSTVCISGTQGINQLIQKGCGYFSFITMDIQMPEIDGITTAKIIRKYEQEQNWKKTPIVFISGNSMERERLTCIDPRGDIKAAFFLRKPLLFTQCQNFVDALLNDKIENKLSVLVVDDDVFNTTVVSNYLKRAGIKCESMHSGADALHKITSGSADYQVILMDCEMPGMDGLTTTMKIKEHLKQTFKHDIIIIGITGHTDKDTLNKCSKAGMQIVYYKPVNFDELIKYIRTYVKI